MITITIETKEDDTITNINVKGKGSDIKDEITIFANNYADILNRIIKSLPPTLQAVTLMTILENRKEVEQ